MSNKYPNYKICSKMDLIDNYPQGYWKVRDKKFINKAEALRFASKVVRPVEYIYFDHVWKNFDRSLLGKYSLDELYKQRALQLREKYDYLILYFSGGADSYNVLRSFIDNGIKIDEVCVKWCNATLESNTHIYTPNTANTTSFNYLSEWDYAIKPVLDWLSKTHPEIKIEIVDWFKEKDLLGSIEIFQTVNHWHDIEVPSLAVWSSTEQKLLDKGKTVGSIYGVDKPNIYFENGSAYMYFRDNAPAIGTPSKNNPFGTEYFYWAPDMPLLTYEMAHCAAKWFIQNKDIYEKYAFDISWPDLDFFLRSLQFQQKELRTVLYSTWTGAFQVDKPEDTLREDKQAWLATHPELIEYRERFYDTSKEFYKNIAPVFLVEGNHGAFRPKHCVTSKYLVC